MTLVSLEQEIKCGLYLSFFWVLFKSGHKLIDDKVKNLLFYSSILAGFIKHGNTECCKTIGTSVFLPIFCTSALIKASAIFVQKCKNLLENFHMVLT